MRYLFLFLCSFALVACGGRNVGPAAATSVPLPANIAPASQLLETGKGQVQAGDAAPNFSFTMADGSRRSLSELRGQKVLLNFWATWCGPCITEMPAIQQATERYREAGVVALGISIEDSALIGQFARDHNLSFPLISDRSTTIVERYGVPALPVTFFINRDGTVHLKHIGPLTPEDITQQIEAMQ
ncbi:MAG: redoxin domain-containing protein [Chloroflexaceae bacterium]|jgi:peroxiredoxin|nr:redoxin domain-containing protein [Chloroflexaceae bacterium]